MNVFYGYHQKYLLICSSYTLAESTKRTFFPFSFSFTASRQLIITVRYRTVVHLEEAGNG